MARPFQETSTLSSRPGRTRFARAASNCCSAAAASSGRGRIATTGADFAMDKWRMFRPSKLPSSVTSYARQNGPRRLGPSTASTSPGVQR